MLLNKESSVGIGGLDDNKFILQCYFVSLPFAEILTKMYYFVSLAVVYL